ncbi:cytochrome c oxidase subunit II [Guptibacillus algicola]|uniref:cytochrome c oxidase subunit II n=1 Tax=Guptibacillus algicola TaxID=225844 RepID=UPI001CD5BC9F|nr:cytochrome c oxidase subunit II [Alkalihalobacillus algicola]MCA0986471.1 cytochrome c oxidase subunit II [Alkalihalobacillus algicola]
MHFHKFEKIWLIVGSGTLIVFLLIIGINAFAMGHTPPSEDEILNPREVDTTPPFDEPGLKKVSENEYELVMVAQAFTFESVKDLKIPKGATVHFKVTSKDVVHGFQIPKTNVNMMITPGHVNSITHTFDETGQFLILCNEYCGVGHQAMGVPLEVIE